MRKPRSNDLGFLMPNLIISLWKTVPLSAIIQLDKLEFANYGGHICFTEKDGTTLVKRLFGMYEDN